jgi:hypothetical protein
MAAPQTSPITHAPVHVRPGASGIIFAALLPYNRQLDAQEGG